MFWRQNIPNIDFLYFIVMKLSWLTQVDDVWMVNARIKYHFATDQKVGTMGAHGDIDFKITK